MRSMRKSVSGLLQVLVLGAMGLAAALNAHAQYPNRPIRLIIPSPPAGGPDIVGRLLALKLADAFGQQVVAENRVGGNGTIAGESVVKATPDGYTMLVGMDSMLAINPHLYSKMPFDPQRDLVPVASLVSNGFFLAVHPSVPAHTLAEFIEHAKRTTPPLAFASGGNGSQHHLTMERLKARAGFDMVHIPYKGGSPATLATVAGDTLAMMSGTSNAGQLRSGKLRAIAYTGTKRSSVMPEVPTIAETYPDFVMTQWYGLFAPIGTPEPIIARWRTETTKVLQSADVIERFKAAGGLEPWISTADEFTAAIRADFQRYGKLVRDLGAKVD